MLDAIVYRVVAGLLNVNVWGGELVDGEQLPATGAVVYVANHARSLGPIAVVSSLPFRVYPWVIGDMLDWGLAPAYLNRDFIEQELHLRPPLSMLVSRTVTQVSVRLLRGVQCVPVWQGDKILETYHASVDRLVRGGPLLIFPEDPQLPCDEISGLRPFKKGFAHLGELCYERAGTILRFIPLAVHARLRQVIAGKPVLFNPHNDRARERARLTSVLETAIRNMLLDATTRSYAGVPLPY